MFFSCSLISKFYILMLWPQIFHISSLTHLCPCLCFLVPMASFSMCLVLLAFLLMGHLVPKRHPYKPKGKLWSILKTYFTNIQRQDYHSESIMLWSNNIYCKLTAYLFYSHQLCSTLYYSLANLVYQDYCNIGVVWYFQTWSIMMFMRF